MEDIWLNNSIWLAVIFWRLVLFWHGEHWKHMVFHVSCLMFSLKMFIFACGKNALSFIILDNLLVHRFTFKQCNWGNRSFYQKRWDFLMELCILYNTGANFDPSPLPLMFKFQSNCYDKLYLYRLSNSSYSSRIVSLARICQPESDYKICAHLTSPCGCCRVRGPFWLWCQAFLCVQWNEMAWIKVFIFCHKLTVESTFSSYWAFFC